MNPISLTIDGAQVKAAPGQSVLEAARKAGIRIPTLCYLEKCGALTRCQVCLVKIAGKLVPSCGVAVEDGMNIESETPEVRQARKTALELLLSEHLGDCLSPCQRLCPMQWEIPAMLREVEKNQIAQAAQRVRKALPLAAVLGRLCHHPCEPGCRRKALDAPVAIQAAERLASEAAVPQLPQKATPTGKRVAVVGAGPSGLCAAWLLAMEGHTVSVYTRGAQAGGSLRTVGTDALPKEILERELSLFEQLGVTFHFGKELSAFAELRREYDGVLLALGRESGVSEEGIFCAASQPGKALVRAMAEAKWTADQLGRHLRGLAPAAVKKPFSCVMGKLDAGELAVFDRAICRDGEPSAGRCLHCDCRVVESCDLKRYAEEYEAHSGRFRGERQQFRLEVQPGGILFEPGKCIRCGICVALTEQAGEPLGLTWIGRGFDVRMGAPLEASIEAGLQRIGAECVAACPTGALTKA